MLNAPLTNTLRPSVPKRGWKLNLAIIHLLIVAALVFSVRYFVWRVLHTANTAALWFFYIFLIAEILNFLESGFFYFTTWKPTGRVSSPPPEGRTVDVFITTYNEPVSLLRETVICAAGMRYPHSTYVLDDGNRAEVRQLAEEFGCRYLARTERKHAKAGNLNHALAQTDGEFVVTLDADHIPMPDLIDRLIGFFADSKVAIVQTSQDFYNLDSFQHLTEWEKRKAWQQQELFFGVIQPGKDSYNAAFYCGSPAMLRRKALEEIGGFATESITEDMHTGLRLQKRGWNLIYYNRTLARGLAPQTYPGFATQWHRWGHGAMQVLRCENPLFGRGLSFAQRICYLGSFYFYWMSYQKLIFVLTPIFSLLTGIFPLVADPAVFAGYFLPFFLFNLIATVPLEGGMGSFLLSEQFNLVKMPVLMKTIAGLFRHESRFVVTPKSKAEAARLADVPALLVLDGGLAVASGVGIWRLFRAGPGFQLWALLVNLLWAMIYLFLTVPAVHRALVHGEHRAAYRFPQRLDLTVSFSFVPQGQAKRKSAQTYARNLNRRGFSITCDFAIPLGTPLEVELSLPGHRIEAQGAVIRNQQISVGRRIRFANGVSFTRIDPSDADEISKYLFWEVAPRHGELLRLTKATQSEARSEGLGQPESALGPGSRPGERHAGGSD